MLRLEALTLVQDDFRLSADFTIEAGARVAVIGPSGAGKSSLLSAIAGFYAPASGRILWAGREIGALAPGARPLSMLFQDGNLFPHLSVADNLGLGISPDLRLSAADRDRIAAALERVGLAGFGPRRPAQLSGGEQSRVALARVLLRARPLLLLDEPFAALGPGLKEQMLDLVAELCAATGITLLMVTHDPQDALRLCPQTVLVAQGVARAPQDTGPFLVDPPEVLQNYLGGRRFL
ncbi:thiamine ABC transporter ATP-binding protein [Falsigemmobacter faecalis]|uniref:ATP-binding cassette domain-containing protein n=1 Tax=Falsigemmobacter faecalis TaxID=2488730 RepID=A0A3P3DWN5_9RHOB|nr:ATP-binding cassette domain-containing protein [Falsigemmobacter faecalis]RRH78551.1 ATP-binding cassette domain-containing protein [Falsigemmobacter faecalis]